MKDDFENVYELIEHAIELAFDGKMQLKFYEFLKYRKTTKAEVDAFLQRHTLWHALPNHIHFQSRLSSDQIVFL